MTKSKKQAAQEILSQSTYLELRKIKVSQENDKVVILDGTVKSFHFKQLAQQAIINNMKDVRIENRLEVLD